MYYYIFEQNFAGSGRRLQQKIKDLIAQAGITGETVLPSPARSLEEITSLGIEKGYSTIIAVGSDIHANKVASAVVNISRPPEQKVVFGVIPTDAKESYLGQLAGVKDLAEAIDALRLRKLAELSVGQVEPNRYFISPVEIIFDQTSPVQISTADFEAVLGSTQITITKDLFLISQDANYVGSRLARVWFWFLGRQRNNLSQTLLHHDRFLLATQQPAAIFLGKELIAKTPATVRRARKALHFIVSRDRVKEGLTMRRN